MKLSIIMPVYNTKSSELSRCVESVIGQTCTDWNLIMVDDGSEPETASLCDEIAQRDSRITVIHQQNAGAGAARNAGTHCADGEYIAYVDSDDVFPRYMVEEALNAVKETGADIVYGMLYKSKNINQILSVINRPPKRETSPCDKETIMRCLIFCGAWEYKNREKFGYIGGGAWARAIKREIAQKAAFPSYKIGEDVIWNFRLLPFCKTLAINWNIWYGYVEQQGSALTKYYGNRLELAENYVNVLREETPDFFSRPQIYGWMLFREFYRAARFDIATPDRKFTPNQKNRELREILRCPPWNLLKRKEYREKLSLRQRGFFLLCRLGYGYSFLSLYYRLSAIFRRRMNHGDA